MKKIKNPYRGAGLPAGAIKAQGDVRNDASAVRHLLDQCPVHAVTPLATLPDLAAHLGVAQIAVKDERTRMGLGSFKALGAAYAIAKQASQRMGAVPFDAETARQALKGQVFAAATAGNHGMSIAAGAKVFGARAVIFIAETVPEGFAAKLTAPGAEVIRAGDEYEASLDAAKLAADENGWQLLSDTSWPGYTELPLDIMEGYLVMAAEAAEQCDAENWQPTHIFLQAGVGGLAAAAAAGARAHWGDTPTIIVVEPDEAPALQASIEAGQPVVTRGDVSNMGRLDCKEPSHLALKSLAQLADYFATVSDDYVTDAIEDLAEEALETSPSGGAGYAGLKAGLAAGDYGLGSGSRVLLYLSEGPADD